MLGSARHPLGTTDFSSFLLKAQASKADVIALSNTGQDSVNTINQAAEFGMTGGKQTFVPLLMFITDVHTLGMQKMQGMNLVEAFYWNRDERTRAWSRRFFEQRKHMPNMVHAGVYSSVLNYLKAVEAAGSDEATAVMKVLKAKGVDDGLFKGRIREDGRLAHDMLLVEVKKPGESTAPWDYYHVKSVIAGDAAAQPLSQSKCKLVKN